MSIHEFHMHVLSYLSSPGQIFIIFDIPFTDILLTGYKMSKLERTLPLSTNTWSV